MLIGSGAPIRSLCAPRSTGSADDRTAAIHAGSRLLIDQASILGGYQPVNIASARVVARGSGHDVTRRKAQAASTGKIVIGPVVDRSQLLVGAVGLVLLIVGVIKFAGAAGDAGAITLVVAGAVLLLSPFV